MNKQFNFDKSLWLAQSEIDASVGEGLRTVHQLDVTFVPDVPENQFERHDSILKYVDDDPALYKRKMPYMANFRKTLPTTVLPTMGGLHLSEKGSLGVTLRYPDLQFYTLTPAGQAKGILPFVKNTLFMRFRCFKTANKQSCRVKANIEWLLEQKILDDFKDIEAIFRIGARLGIC